MKACMKRARVLYVAGQGRTGSTVLGRTLSGLPDVAFVGELCFFWRRFANRELCSCGQPLPECAFWSEVIIAAFGVMTRDQALRFAEMERGVLRRQMRSGRRTVDRDHQIREVRAERALLYRAIAQVARTTWIVDTGKQPAYGSIIARLDGVDFCAIHIVRDPRGVAFSWQKHVRSDSEPGELERRSAWNSAAHWLWQNLLIQWVLQRRRSTYLRVRYEDLVTRLPEVVDAISSATGMTIPSPDEVARDLAVRPVELHLVAGNPGVRAKGGAGLALTLDEEWRESLPPVQRRIVTAICAVLMPAYGYPVFSPTIHGSRLSSTHTSERAEHG
jgi:hypothetical protein